MLFNNLLVEEAQIVAGFVPVDMSVGANAGDWVSMKDYDRCTIVLFKAAGTAGDNPTLTLQQGQDVSGTGAKALNFTRVDVKQGTQTGIGTFTTVTQAAGNTYTSASGAQNQAVWVVEVKAEDLDSNNNFDCLTASVADVGTNAQLGCMLYILRGARYGSNPLPSAIID